MKKYYLRHKYLGIARCWNYLNYIHPKDEFILASHRNSTSYQTQFTEDEINEIAAMGINLTIYERVEVEEE